MAFNMPPGVSPNDIPGNSAEDGAWEDATEKTINDATANGMALEDYIITWELGLAVWKALKKWGGKFPHE